MRPADYEDKLVAYLQGPQAAGDANQGSICGTSVASTIMLRLVALASHQVLITPQQQPVSWKLPSTDPMLNLFWPPLHFYLEWFKKMQQYAVVGRSTQPVSDWQAPPPLSAASFLGIGTSVGARNGCIERSHSKNPATRRVLQR